MSTTDLSPNVVLKLQILQKKLGAEDLKTARDKSLNIANFVADTIHDLGKKFIIERDGKLKELLDIS